MDCLIQFYAERIWYNRSNSLEKSIPIIMNKKLIYMKMK